jgi:hypothetical protein
MGRHRLDYGRFIVFTRGPPVMILCGKEYTIAGRLVRIARLAAEGFEFVDSPDDIVMRLRSAATRVDLFTFRQRLPDTSPRYAYPHETDNVAALPISTFEEWWTRQIDGKTRNMVRRSEKKGVVLREVPFDETLVNGIFDIYNESPVRQGRRFPHYGKDCDAVRAMSATFLRQSVFLGAFLADRLIGFAKLTLDDARSQAAIMHIIAMLEHRDKAPTNALIAQAVRSCAQRHIPYLVYSHFAYGKKQRDSLSDFKTSNGFVRIDLPRYYIPLTTLGRFALSTGLHRTLRDRIPESAAARLREFRNAWYARHLGSAQRLS